VQVLAGPRQVGKTTLARQVMEGLKCPAHYVSADEPTLRDRTWIEQQWDLARLKARADRAGALLVLDEVQKVPGWSAIAKLLWDTDEHGVDDRPGGADAGGGAAGRRLLGAAAN
jgi:predicted AAA+ superfamily ATPase